MPFNDNMIYKYIASILDHKALSSSILTGEILIEGGRTPGAALGL
jgi:hypothetical protein